MKFSGCSGKVQGCWVGKRRLLGELGLLGRKAQVVVRKISWKTFSRPDNVVICCPILTAGLGQWWAPYHFYSSTDSKKCFFLAI